MKILLFIFTLIISLVIIPFAAHSQSTEINLNQGLLSYLKLNEEYTEINDNIGLLKGIKYGTTYTENTIVFDRENDFIVILNHDFSNLGEGSISLWFKVQKIPTRNGIRPILYYGAKDPCINMPDASNQGLIIEVAHDSMHYRSKNLYFTSFANGCDYPSFCYDSNKPMEENIWYHFVAIVGKNFNTGYLNGVEMNNRRYNFGDSTYSQFFKDTVKHDIMWIGKAYWNSEPMFFNGSIKNIRIYDRPLTENEIKYLYDKNL